MNNEERKDRLTDNGSISEHDINDSFTKTFENSSKNENGF